MGQYSFKVTPLEVLPPGVSRVLLPLKRQCLYPFVLAPVYVDSDVEKAAVRKAMQENRLIAAVPQVPPAERWERRCEEPLELRAFGDAQLSEIGVEARIIKMLEFPDGSMRVLLRGIRRIRTEAGPVLEKIPYVRVMDVTEKAEDETAVAALRDKVQQQFQNLTGMLPNFPEELRVSALNVEEPSRSADVIADTVNGITPEEKLIVLQQLDIAKRLEFLLGLLNREIETTDLGNRIQEQVHTNLSQNQRDFFLREQLRVIKEELNEDGRNPDIIEIEKRMKEPGLPDNVRETITKELSRLELIPTASPEYHISYNYIDWLLSLPWNRCSEDNLDVAQAAAVLEEDHYGLEDVKKRILEFLAVLALKPDRKSPILCLVGPPGVGKTSLGQSIARATARKFVRMSLGGVHDEAEIRGHRRTYVGALPGRIIQNLKKVGTANPVFMLDEIDKLGSDQRGDPASALLEVLDPEQNKTFSDHYLELDFDLSRVFFIATANVLDTIPAPLLDRMEIIRLPGYTNFEKRQIARRYLVPRQITENGLKKTQISFPLSAVDELIDFYTREAGVRNLEQQIASVCRKIARRVVEKTIPDDEKTKVTPQLVRELLGARRFLMDEASKAPDAGSATGMAWTAVGGAILTVESLMMPGKGELKLTGSLGDVMKESAEAAFSLLKSRAGSLGIDGKLFEKHNFHVHVPDGATPKDGPSAGITIFSALYSRLTCKQTLPALSMTGEINLRGQVTAIGGLKEKVIAALRSGVKIVVMPKENVKDLEEIPPEVREKLEFRPVERVEEALAAVFGKDVGGEQ